MKVKVLEAYSLQIKIASDSFLSAPSAGSLHAKTFSSLICLVVTSFGAEHTPVYVFPEICLVCNAVLCKQHVQRTGDSALVELFCKNVSIYLGLEGSSFRASFSFYRV